MCFDVSIPIRLICSTDGSLCLRSATTSVWHTRCRRGPSTPTDCRAFWGAGLNCNNAAGKGSPVAGGRRARTNRAWRTGLGLHGRVRYLNMTEIELSALGRDLPDRVGDRAMLERHVPAWRHRPNAAAITADWQFTTKDACIKLRKLYPIMEG